MPFGIYAPFLHAKPALKNLDRLLLDGHYDSAQPRSNVPRDSGIDFDRIECSSLSQQVRNWTVVSLDSGLGIGNLPFMGISSICVE